MAAGFHAWHCSASGCCNRRLPSGWCKDHTVEMDGGSVRRNDSRFYCQVCSLAYNQHERCSSCGILIGSGHTEARSYNGACNDCARSRRR